MISKNPFSGVHFSLSLAQDAQTDTGLRHSVVRKASFREREGDEKTHVRVIHYQSHWQPSWKSVCFCTSLEIRFKKTNQTDCSHVSRLKRGDEQLLTIQYPSL